MGNRQMASMTDTDEDVVVADGEQAGLRLGPLPNLVGYVMRRAQLLIFDDFIKTMASIDLRPASYSVMAVIDANPGSTQSAVSAALGLQRTNLVAIIDQLEERGLARRAPAKADKRSYALTLTAKGKRLLGEANELVAQHEQRMRAPLQPHEAEQLMSLLHRLNAGIGR
jgi:DNA-binding MarR family transcriptional regulator